MTSKSTQQLAKRLGYEFSNPELLELALTHRSVGKQNNERLEFLGDSILNCLIAESLFHQFPDAPEGDLSRMRASLVKGVTLAEIAKELELGECLLLGSGEMKSGGHRRESILADAVEAIIGAIFIDSSMSSCRDLVDRLFESRLGDISPTQNIKDAKTTLQELLQSKKKPLPEYTLCKTSGKDHAQTFEVSCKIVSIDKTFVGVGSNRRSAEQSAAAQAIEYLNNQ